MHDAIDLPYHPDSTALFEYIADRPWAAFLDSGWPLCEQGRYDILTANPRRTLVCRGGQTEIRDAAGTQMSREDPFALLRHALGQHLNAQPGAAAEPIPGIPFRGGALGWFGYDLARRIETLPTLALDAEQLPEMAVGLYDWALVVDHRQARSRLVWSGPEMPAALPRLAALFREQIREQIRQPAPPQQRAFQALAKPQANLTRAAYGAAFARIQRYIRNGDCYQVNLAQRFAAPVQGDTWEAYRRLRRLSPAPFSAYLRTPYGRVLSASPERFLQLHNGDVTTRPIKGTRPRGADAAADAALARALADSPKDRAENLMIVDLLRNDIGRVCEIGSVHTPELFAVERFATVHHLVSTIRGRLRPGEDSASLLRACFPGGSITGAPKIRAMQIIEELEPHRRGIYCGAIGYLGVDGNMDTNIAIRTLVESDEVMRCWAGGGIVADSEVEAEYQETLDKAAAMLTLLGA
ncbi:aminodeoxychorismate synthase component I [Thiohalocapsa marina]|uniref:aminodeoxychorismate synthase n=1 Tax=Thiohalocapsa marina TaxID=424902 RepID=A0A5M8FTY5_9GAMM|nr:aminodeoxychorismate synthase component I [Thiohalocapsa marina]KAA6187265.1 aminodeoxychorismate synthase component I [Thiohalocapsa marina]